MILSIGEILADMVGNEEDGTLTFKAFCGGAPFNVAVNAKKAGASVAFVGKVGKDVIGRFVRKEALKANLEFGYSRRLGAKYYDSLCNLKRR